MSVRRQSGAVESIGLYLGQSVNLTGSNEPQRLVGTFVTGTFFDVLGLKAERALLATALEDVQAMAATLTGYLMAAQENPAELYKVGLGSVRFLMSVGDLMIGWLLQQHAAVAIAALDQGASGDDRAFYEGKIAVGSFFAKNFLPLLTSTRQVIEHLDNEVMELDEAAF